MFAATAAAVAETLGAEAVGLLRTGGAAIGESLGEQFGLPTNARQLNDRVYGLQNQIRLAGQKRLRLVPRPAGMSLNDYVKKSRATIGRPTKRFSRPKSIGRPAKRGRLNPGFGGFGTRPNYRVGNYRGKSRRRKKWKRRVRRARRRW